MIGKSAVVLVIRPVAEQVEELGVHDGNDKVEGVIRIGDDDKHGRLPVPEQVQLHLVVAHDLPQLGDIEGCQTGAAGNQD